MREGHFINHFNKGGSAVFYRVKPQILRPLAGDK